MLLKVVHGSTSQLLGDLGLALARPVALVQRGEQDAAVGPGDLADHLAHGDGLAPEIPGVDGHGARLGAAAGEGVGAEDAVDLVLEGLLVDDEGAGRHVQLLDGVLAVLAAAGGAGFGAGEGLLGVLEAQRVEGDVGLQDRGRDRGLGEALVSALRRVHGVRVAALLLVVVGAARPVRRHAALPQLLDTLAQVAAAHLGHLAAAGLVLARGRLLRLGVGRQRRRLGQEDGRRLGQLVRPALEDAARHGQVALLGEAVGPVVLDRLGHGRRRHVDEQRRLWGDLVGLAQAGAGKGPRERAHGGVLYGPPREGGW